MEGYGGFRESLFRRIEKLSSKLDFSSVLLDRRNGVFVVYAALLLSLVLPSAVILFVHFTFAHAALHVALVLFVSAETFTSILHNTSHRPLFAPHWSALNLIVPYVMCPLMGQTWNTYYYHHCKHHHVEDNGDADLSSTAAYQRDSAWQFGFYFLRFLLCIQVELAMYFIRRRQFANAAKMLGGELFSLAVFAGFTYWKPLPGMAVFIIPLLVMRFGMMAANWGQHAFTLPLTIIDASYNAVAFNDGYHLSHHHNPLKHWSEHPLYKAASCPLVTPLEDTITLRGLSFGDVWLMLMLHDYPGLARCYVFTGEGARPSQDAIMQQLRAQVRPRVSKTAQQGDKR